MAEDVGGSECLRKSQQEYVSGAGTTSDTERLGAVASPYDGQSVGDVAIRLFPARLTELAFTTLAHPDERGAYPVGVLQQRDAGIATGADRALGGLLLGVALDPHDLAVAHPNKDRAAHGAHLADARDHLVHARSLCGRGSWRACHLPHPDRERGHRGSGGGNLQKGPSTWRDGHGLCSSSWEGYLTVAGMAMVLPDSQPVWGPRSPYQVK